MSGIRLFNVHYLWEDILSMGLGALILLTSWMFGDAGTQGVATNAAIVGILVLALGSSEFLALRRWEEGLEIACGLWLVASPFVLGYSFSVPLSSCWQCWNCGRTGSWATTSLPSTAGVSRSRR